jgi:hypothetical protein
MTKTCSSTARARSRSSQWAGRKSSRDGDDCRAVECQHPVELGEADVVAEGQADYRPGAVIAPWTDGRNDSGIARGDGVRLPELHAPEGHIEQVDLAVGGQDGTVGAYQAAGIEQSPIRPPGQFWNASDHQVDPVAGRDGRRPGQGRTIQLLGLLPQHLGGPGHREVLGQDDEFSTGVGGLVDQGPCGGQVGIAVGSSRRLYGGNAHVTG